MDKDKGSADLLSKIHYGLEPGDMTGRGIGDWGKGSHGQVTLGSGAGGALYTEPCSQPNPCSVLPEQ